MTMLTRATMASRGRDGGGVVRHLAYIAMERFPERKEKIEGEDSASAILERGIWHRCGEEEGVRHVGPWRQ
jgi:hypothetical protein